MAHLSTANRHDTTLGDKESNERRIEVRMQSVQKSSLTSGAFLTHSTPVITSVSSSDSSLSFHSENNNEENDNFFGNQTYFLSNEYLLLIRVTKRFIC